uniref:Uncharacterized protein n=1 Tax=Anopheles epiroticus TaxID=199890 RepID=A0A182P6R5_9DIPT
MVDKAATGCFVLPADGSIDTSPILQRTTVGIGQIKIQAVATCLFLCMDTCGSVYGSVSTAPTNKDVTPTADGPVLIIIPVPRHRLEVH